MFGRNDWPDCGELATFAGEVAANICTLLGVSALGTDRWECRRVGDTYNLTLAAPFSDPPHMATGIYNVVIREYRKMLSPWSLSVTVVDATGRRYTKSE